ALHPPSRPHRRLPPLPPPPPPHIHPLPLHDALPISLTRRRGCAAVPSGASLGPQALFTRRLQPPLALTRRRGCAAVPSGASLGPQALFTRRLQPPLALTRRRGCAAVPSGASLGPQALFTRRLPPPLALTRRRTVVRRHGVGSCDALDEEVLERVSNRIQRDEVCAGGRELRQ